MNRITITGKQRGPILPLHGVNCAPYSRSGESNQPLVKKLFSRAHIPYCRLHDVMGAYGGTYYVDVPNIFRDFDKDENDPANYDFWYSDEYIAAIIDAGTQIVYRLGVTIEWGSKKYTIHPPRDAAKWARICEKIIAHYNEGWCNGFHYGIEYWEIWNEPENPPMWTGTPEDFYALYRTASCYLKEKYPALKIGGYGSCGFYAVTNPESDSFYRSFLSFFKDFLEMCRREHCPLDFFSWHLYTDSPSMLLEHAAFARKTLDEYGFSGTESHLNEWNYHAGEGCASFANKHTAIGAAFLAAALIGMQKSGLVDLAMYYVFSSTGMYNGFLNQNDHSIDPPYWIFAAFGDLFRKGTELETVCEGAVQALAATDGKEGALLLTNYSDRPEEVTIEAPGELFLCTLDEHFDAPGEAHPSRRLTLPPYGTAFFRLR